MILGFKTPHHQKRGFLLVEMLVSIALFSVVIVVAIGALLSVVEASRKAQAVKTVSNNLAFALETMARNMRMGRNISCSTTNTTLDSCPNGGSAVTFVSEEGEVVTYRFRGSRLERRVGLSGQFVPLTAPEVRIVSAVFRVDGVSRTDREQPRVLMNIKGQAGVGGRGEVDFNIQSMISQRVVDFPYPTPSP